MWVTGHALIPLYLGFLGVIPLGFYLFSRVTAPQLGMKSSNCPSLFGFGKKS